MEGMESTHESHVDFMRRISRKDKYRLMKVFGIEDALLNYICS